MTVIPETRRAH